MIGGVGGPPRAPRTNEDEYGAPPTAGTLKILFDQKNLKIFRVGLAQHDELESNLKKILHRNGIWGLEAIIM